MDRPPLEGGKIAVRGSRIVDVGRDVETCGATRDLGDVVLMPGLVNAHAHLEFSCMRLAKPQAGSLPEWIRGVIAERGRRDRDVRGAIASGIVESLSCGVTAVGEIVTAPLADYSAKLLPRMVLFHEVIGFSAARLDSVEADLHVRLEQTSPEDAGTVGVSPHAPYTVHPELLSRLVALSAARNMPLAMHLAESAEELQLLREGEGPFQELLAERSMWDASAIPPGTSPLDYLKALAGANRVLVVHGNYLTDNEINFIAARRNHMSVAYCPRTHEYFRHPKYPLAKMRAAGVRVVLGTDSRASNPDLSLLVEMQTVARHFPEIAPADIHRMAAIDAAIALGLESEIGSLRQGKCADLAALACPSYLRDPYEALLAPTAKITAVWLRGRALSSDQTSICEH